MLRTATGPVGTRIRTALKAGTYDNAASMSESPMNCSHKTCRHGPRCMICGYGPHAAIHGMPKEYEGAHHYLPSSALWQGVEVVSGSQPGANPLAGAARAEVFRAETGSAREQPDLAGLMFSPMPPSESPITQQELVSAILHHAREIVRLSETWPALEPVSPKGNPCLEAPDGCLRSADNTECWPCDHATRK